MPESPGPLPPVLNPLCAPPRRAERASTERGPGLTFTVTLRDVRTLGAEVPTFGAVRPAPARRYAAAGHQVLTRSVRRRCSIRSRMSSTRQWSPSGWTAPGRRWAPPPGARPGTDRAHRRRMTVDADTPEIPVGIDGETVMLPAPVRCAIRTRAPRGRPEGTSRRSRPQGGPGMAAAAAARLLPRRAGGRARLRPARQGAKPRSQ